MAGGQDEEISGPRLPRLAGGKRAHAPESLTPRKSARLSELRQGQAASEGISSKCIRHDSDHGADRGEKRTQSGFRRRRRTHTGPATYGEHVDEQRKRRRRPDRESTLIPSAVRVNTTGDDEHPISHWAADKRWPRSYIAPDRNMENILARKRSASSRSRRTSDTDPQTLSSSNQGEQKSREQKSAEYKKPQYATVLATKGIFMEESELEVSRKSKRDCKHLLEQGAGVPEHSLFRNDIFKATCKGIQDRNEARVVQDITRLIVPSAETLHTYGAMHLGYLVESVNDGWDNSIPITKTRPQPDYATGFRREAFTQEQLDRMHPIIGDFSDQSYFMATWSMYFPFLTCEVKCGAAALDVADRQNTHSMAIAVRAVVELFRTVNLEKELHREILAFSISHDHRTVRIYGHYAEIDDSGTKYYRHPIHTFDFTALDGKERWTAYRFTKNVYEHWVPKHFERICSAIDQIPADISFSVSRSELRFSEPSSGMSRGLTAYSIAQSSAGSASAEAQDDTPSTSVNDEVFKKPRRGNARTRT